MATQDGTVAFILDQLSGVEGVTARKMFGEYGLSCQGKSVGVICNDQLYIKMTAPGKILAADAAEEPPYRGAKPALLIDAEHLEDADWLAGLVQATADALPIPKPKKRKAKQGLRRCSIRRQPAMPA